MNVLYYSLFQRFPFVLSHFLQNFCRPLDIVDLETRRTFLDILVESLRRVVLAKDREDIVPVASVRPSILDRGKKESSYMEPSYISDRSEVDCEDESVSSAVDLAR